MRAHLLRQRWLSARVVLIEAIGDGSDVMKPWLMRVSFMTWSSDAHLAMTPARPNSCMRRTSRCHTVPNSASTGSSGFKSVSPGLTSNCHERPVRVSDVRTA